MLANRLSFVFALCAVLLGAEGSLTAADGRTQYGYPGRVAGGIAFDDRGGLWVAEGGRSEGSTKIYYLKDSKLIRSVDVPVKWIGALTYARGALWATTGQIVQIDPATGKVVKTIKVQEPTEHTGLAFDGRVLLYSLRKKMVVVRTGAREVSRRSGTRLPKHHRAGGLAFDGKGVWMLSHDYGLISRVAGGEVAAEKGLVIPRDKSEHRISDIDWDGKSFWVSLTKRLGNNKYDNAILKVDTVDYRLDSAIPHATVRVNAPCEGSLILQRTKGSQRPRYYASDTGEYSIPEGEYRVLEHAYLKTDQANYKWRVRVHDRGTLTVKADGRVRDIRIGTGLAGTLTIHPPTARWQQGRYSLRFAIVDSTGARVQFRRVLKTPDASFVMRDKSGQKVASGQFSAGIDGYLGYHIRIPRQAELPLSVTVSLDSGPFDIKLDTLTITKLPAHKP